ncbi:MAG: 1-aminocyclopropane-1-carboxylate deaminase/D-cysteine desulfhydrase, partial [Burkholderiaceae bacterium]
MRVLAEDLHTSRRLKLARTPTPIQLLPRLSELLGSNLYCKRDDLTGFGFGGSKIRKLEFLLHEAHSQGCDTLVTCGSNQSNWCCMAAVTGAVLGMDVYLVLGGAAPERDTGNIRLARIAGAKVSHVESAEGDVLEAASSELTRTLKARGQRPYQIITGGSTGLGALGYVNAFHEIADFARSADVYFSKIIHATGSGGTQAGLIAGAMLQGWEGDIIGMAVSRNKADQQHKVRGVLQQMLPDEAVQDGKIIVDDAFVGGGYRCKT